jgi:hypothetical protein
MAMAKLDLAKIFESVEAESDRDCDLTEMCLNYLGGKVKAMSPKDSYVLVILFICS